MVDMMDAKMVVMMDVWMAVTRVVMMDSPLLYELDCL